MNRQPVQDTARPAQFNSPASGPFFTTSNPLHPLAPIANAADNAIAVQIFFTQQLLPGDKRPPRFHDDLGRLDDLLAHLDGDLRAGYRGSRAHGHVTARQLVRLEPSRLMKQNQTVSPETGTRPSAYPVLMFFVWRQSRE